MARTNTSANASAKSELRSLLRELLAEEGLTQASDAPAKGRTQTPKESVPFMSCWPSSKVSKLRFDKQGKFTHTNRAKETRSYKRLSEAEAIELVKANYEAGRIYAVSA